MIRTTTNLIELYERCLNWLRSPSLRRPPRSFGHSQPIEPVQVDLIGISTPLSKSNGGEENIPTFGLDSRSRPKQSSQGLNTDESALTKNPFGSSLNRKSDGLANAPWSFNQTVLLRKQRKGASVLVWTGIGTVGLLGIWAVTAPLAETIAVEGKLEPGRSTTRVDAPVPGVVEAVLVKEGQQVRKGEPLVIFDLREPRSRLAAAESIRERLLNENQIAAATLGDPAATAGLTLNQRKQLSSQSEELATRQEAARQELKKAEARLSGEQASLSTYQNIANRFAGLVANGAASEVQLLEARQKVQQSQTTISEGLREIARLQSTLANTGAITKVELRQKVETNLREIAELDSQIRLARQQIQYGQLTAPFDGIVFDIEASPGSVVAQGTASSASASGKSLMKVVPQDALQAKIYLPNNSVAFVRPGLKAELSINAFNASDFGTVPAVVERIASDALTADEQSRVLGKETTGLYYAAILRLNKQTILLRNKTAPLQAGMTLTADIKLRERRFINIFTGFFEDQRRNLERIR